MANPVCQPGMFDIDIDDGNEGMTGYIRGGMGGIGSQNGGPDGSVGSGAGSGSGHDGEHAINLDIEIQVSAGFLRLIVQIMWIGGILKKTGLSLSKLYFCFD